MKKRIIQSFLAILFLHNFTLLVESQLISSNYLCKPNQNFQCFEKVPSATYKILVGYTVVFPCTIQNLISHVQWRLKNTMMGFNVTQYGRFYLLGNTKAGDFQLQLRNVSKDDEGSYECQVSPKNERPLMRWSTELKVFVKPQEPFFLNLLGNTVLEVSPSNTRVNIICVSNGGDPPAQITWRINEKQVVKNNSISIENKNSQSQLSILTTKISNGDKMTCVVTSEAMKLNLDPQAREYRISVMVQKDKEPGQPVIQGFNKNTKYREGDRLSMSCWATAGMPQGSLIWKRIRRNGVEESLSFQYKREKDRLVNEISTVLSSHDHNAEFKCIAQNRITNLAAKESSIQVTVEYPPDSISLMTNNSSVPPGVDIIVEGNVGTSDILVCKTGLFYGHAKITWFNESMPLASHLYSEESKSEGRNGKFIVSKLVVTFHKNDNGRFYKCLVQGVSDVEHIARVRLRIKFPPSEPTIKMLPQEDNVQADQEVFMHCQTSDGNPLPTLDWYKNEQIVQNNIQQEIQGSVVTSTLKIIPKISDHGAKFRCMAKNSALPKGVKSRYITLNVLFPPQNIKLVSQSSLPAASNSSVILRCTADTSNPPAFIVWEIIPCDLRPSSMEISFYKIQTCRRRDNINSHFVMEYNSTSITSQTNSNGDVYVASISYLQLLVTENMDLSTIVCRATNEPFKDRHTLMDEKILRVAYAPRLVGNVHLEPVQQGTSRSQALGLLANPQLTGLRLLRNGSPIPVDHARLRLDTELVRLNISQVKVVDMGKYVLVASNNVGVSHIPLFINVTYPVSITRAVMLTNTPVWPEDKHQVRLECQANGNPIPQRIQWKFNKKQIGCDQIKKNDSGQRKWEGSCQKHGNQQESITLELAIDNVNRLDIANYVCEANNGVGSPASSAAIKMMVDMQPHSVMNSTSRRVAAQMNRVATLTCRIRAWPKPLFSWFVLNKESRNPVIQNKKYKLSAVSEVSGTKLGTFEQEITISQIESDDYKTYECQAQNTRGSQIIKITVTGTSKPDEPRALRAENITATSVDVSWIAGHNGGFSQTFNVKFEVAGLTLARYEDVIQPADGSALVRTRLEHLRPGHTYSIRVNARNAEHGASEYTSPVTISTLPVLSNRKPQTPESSSLLVIVSSCIAGFFVLLINISCLACFLRRRQQGQRCGQCLRSSENHFNHHDDLQTYSDEIHKTLDNVELFPSRINSYNRRLPTKHNFRCHQPLSSKCSLYGDYNDYNESNTAFLSNNEHEACQKYLLSDRLQPIEQVQSHCTLSRVGPDVALSCSPKKYYQSGSNNVWQSNYCKPQIMNSNCLVSNQACCANDHSPHNAEMNLHCGGLPMERVDMTQPKKINQEDSLILSNQLARPNTLQNALNYNTHLSDGVTEIAGPFIKCAPMFDQEQYAAELRRIQNQNASSSYANNIIRQRNSFLPLTINSNDLEFPKQETSNILLSNQKKFDSEARSTTAVQQNGGLTAIKLGTFLFPDSHVV